MRVPTEQVIATVKELHSRYYKGDDVKGHDIEDVVRSAVKREFEATGEGIPPPPYLRRYNESAAVPLPDWTMGPLEATGEGTDPALDTPQGRLKAARAAELDAKRKLAERIAGLEIEPGMTVRDFVARNESIRGLVDAVLVTALVTKTEISASAARVTVAVPGMQVWEIINGALAHLARH